MAAKIGRLGSVLAFVGVGLDAWDWHQAAKSAKKRETARRKASQFLNSSKGEVRKSLLGGNGRSEGPRAYLDAVGAEVIRLRDAIGIEIGEKETAIVTGVAHIQAELDLTGNDITRTGERRNRPHGCNQAVVASRERFCFSDELGCGA